MVRDNHVLFVLAISGSSVPLPYVRFTVLLLNVYVLTAFLSYTFLFTATHTLFSLPAANMHRLLGDAPPALAHRLLISSGQAALLRRVLFHTAAGLTVIGLPVLRCWLMVVPGAL